MKTKLLFTLIILIEFFSSSSAQGTWIQKNAIYNGWDTQSNFHCSIGNKGYIGFSANPSYTYWYEFDPIADIYIPKAILPDTATSGASIFSIAGNCYVLSNGNVGNRLWKYDPIADIWTNMLSNFPGQVRYGSYYFSIGSKGYIGGGKNLSGTTFQDFWEYNSITNLWAPLSNLPTANALGEAFSVNGKGYITGGYVPNGPCPNTTNVYEFDPAFNLWTLKNNTPDGRYAASSFVIGNDAYLGMGIVYDLIGNTAPNYSVLKYDYLLDSWQQVADIPHVGIYDEGVGFSINGKGYMGLGDCYSLVPPHCGIGYLKNIFD